MLWIMNETQRCINRATVYFLNVPIPFLTEVCSYPSIEKVIIIERKERVSAVVELVSILLYETPMQNESESIKPCISGQAAACNV